MQKLFVSLMVSCVVACGGGTNLGDDLGGGDDGPGGVGCDSDHCVCAGDVSCDHECSLGASECHVQGSTGPVDITCNENGDCHVECSQAESCHVDCGDSADCNVTCSVGSCEVDNCVEGSCVVACLTGEATISGTTATCP